MKKWLLIYGPNNAAENFEASDLTVEDVLKALKEGKDTFEGFCAKVFEMDPPSDFYMGGYDPSRPLPGVAECLRFIFLTYIPDWDMKLYPIPDETWDNIMHT